MVLVLVKQVLIFSKTGSDFNIQAQQRLWASPNQRHEFHVGGSYDQHFGGYTGNTKPNLSAGIGYVFKF